MTFLFLAVFATAAVGASLGLAVGRAVRRSSRAVRAVSLALVLAASLAPVQIHYGIAHQEAVSEVERRALEGDASAEVVRAALDRFVVTSRGAALAGLTLAFAGALVVPAIGVALPLGAASVYYLSAYVPLTRLSVPDYFLDNVKNVWLFFLAASATLFVAAYVVGARDLGRE